MTEHDAEQRVSDDTLSNLCHRDEQAISPVWGNDHTRCADLALDLRDCRERLAQVEAERERFAHECEVCKQDFADTIKGATVMRDDMNALRADADKLRKALDRASNNHCVCTALRCDCEDVLAATAPDRPATPPEPPVLGPYVITKGKVIPNVPIKEKKP
jgi:hypothetical protein